MRSAGSPTQRGAVATLLVDNFDSFTYNLFALITATTGAEPAVVTNDVTDIDLDRFDNIVVAPGPGTPDHAADIGIGARLFADATIPVLGVCLGHQLLCATAGAHIVRAPAPAHGIVSQIQHTGTDLFDSIPSPLSVVRYHSLVAVDVPDILEVTARTDDGLVMAVRHRSRPQWGVQFHPESIASDRGEQLLANFRDLTVSRRQRRHRPTKRRRIAPAASRPARMRLNYRTVAACIDAAAVYDAMFEDSDHAFWLDGTAAHSPDPRVSILGDDRGPHAHQVITHGDVVRAVSPLGGEPTITTDTLSTLQSGLDTHRADLPDGYPIAFAPGYVGFLGYETHTGIEGRATHATTAPDAWWVFADRAIAVDHDRNVCHLVWLSDAGSDADGRAWADRTRAALLALAAGTDDPFRPVPDLEIAAEFRLTREEYLSRINDAMALIRDGETYEVCLTDRAEIEGLQVDPVTLFHRLRRVSPAPYAALLRFGNLSVVSASPERFLRVGTDREIDSKPIKGTRARGATPASDLAAAAELSSSPKELAENLMIVDLVRNDLTRVCEPASVGVPVLFDVETYSTVHQLVSTVRGHLRPDVTAVDAVRAAFPPGSMTGAPKLRTMHILDSLEQGPRGIYSGTAGWLSVTGTADLSVVIRTIVIDHQRISFGVGGAITAMSDPNAEYEEILLKARATSNALANAVTGESAAPVRRGGAEPVRGRG